jgi:hypothetical protein
MKTENDLEKPQNLRERRAAYRYFYNTNPEVSDFIDMNSAFSVSLEKVYSKNPVKKYAFNFFESMFSKLDLWNTLNQIAKEHLIFGNCTIFVVEDDWIKNKKKSPFDLNVNYRGWLKIMILPPDQIRVRKIPLNNGIVLEYLPDPETRKFLAKEKNLKSFRRSVPEFLKTGIIPLDTDPYSGSFATLFARRISPYEPLGTSILERHMESLSNKKKTFLVLSNEAQKLFKSQLKKFVEEFLFLPVAIKKGFFDSEHRPIYPKVIIK